MAALVMALVFFGLATCSVAHAATTNVVVTFTAPTQWDDGTALAPTDIAGYVLSYTVNGIAQPDIPLPPAPAQYVFSGVTVAKYCVRLATKATSGTVGAQSAEVCRKPQAKPPIVIIN